MKSYGHIAKFILFFLLTLPFITGSVQETNNLSQNNELQQNGEDKEHEEPSYFQAFDVVSQNVQLVLAVPFLPDIKSTHIQKKVSLFINDTFVQATTHFFRILFQLIISPNAP
jgi:hypothetical protein